MEQTRKSLGQVGYEAYGAAAGWKTFDGREMPLWSDLDRSEAGRETQRRWGMSASAIVEAADESPSTEPRGA